MRCGPGDRHRGTGSTFRPSRTKTIRPGRGSHETEDDNSFQTGLHSRVQEGGSVAADHAHDEMGAQFAPCSHLEVKAAVDRRGTLDPCRMFRVGDAVQIRVVVVVNHDHGPPRRPVGQHSAGILLGTHGREQYSRGSTVPSIRIGC